MAYASQLGRDALRRALRNHPGADVVTLGQRVNDLTLTQLKDRLTMLGLDPDAIVKAALSDDLQTTATAAIALNTGRDETITQEAPMILDEPIDAIEAEVQTIRSLIVQGGFGALDDRLRQLITEARKPPVEILVPAAPLVPGAPVHAAKVTGRSETWRKLFDVKGDLGRRDTAIWDGTHPDTPKVNDRYIWPQPATATALSQLARGRNVFLTGPKGTGKTEFAQQLAARTGRPFALISCDAGTDGATLTGMTVPDASGGVSWQDGQLTKAIKTPGCVICLDEPSVARSGALFVFQNVLEHRQLFIAETGAKIPVASGVLFIATDNTNGTGGGARRGYTDTNRLNAAFLDRFGVFVKFDYMPKDKERTALCSYVPGCTVELAELLISAASVTRAAADDQTLSAGIGLRRLLSWAELLVDGIDPETAFQSAVLNCTPEQDVETLREQCLLAYDREAVARALNPSMPAPPADPSLSNPTPAGREAASEFTAV
jgi:MoxR-like ATPase